MILFPAVDIREGKAVRLAQGKRDQVSVYSDDPLETARKWQDCGAQWLHIIDLDGAFDGYSPNIGIISQIAALPGICVQIGGGIRSLEAARRYLDAGASRLIIGTAAIESPDLFAEMCAAFPGKLGVSLDASNGQVKTRGWLKDAGLGLHEILPRLSEAAFLIYTDIERDGMRAGVNLRALQNLLNMTDKPVIAAGGVGSLEDLARVANLSHNGNLEGVITGRAIYDGSLDLATALQWLRESGSARAG